MKLSRKNSVGTGLTEKQREDLRKKIAGSTELADALRSELETRVARIDKNLDNTEELAKLPNMNSYILGLLATRKELKSLIDLLT